MSTTSIEWATHVWNPVIGCDRVSPGCAHCYALELAPRLRAMQQARGQADGAWATQADGGAPSGPAFAVRTLPAKLEEPLRWRTRRRVFVNSMSDLFHEQVPFEYIAAVFGVMQRAETQTFLVLTKRPERMREFFTWYAAEAVEREVLGQPGELAEQEARAHGVDEGLLWGSPTERWPLPNVWLGVSIENRRYVHRADELRATPAALRFVSAEPLLGPLVIPATHAPDVPPDWKGHNGIALAGIDWLIAGGESGARHRAMRAEWVRDLRDVCNRSGTAFFFKQWGGRTPKAGGRVLDGRTWDQLPAVAA